MSQDKKNKIRAGLLFNPKVSTDYSEIKYAAGVLLLHFYMIRNKYGC
jgi:hypothetical protein